MTFEKPFNISFSYAFATCVQVFLLFNKQCCSFCFIVLVLLSLKFSVLFFLLSSIF